MLDVREADHVLRPATHTEIAEWKRGRVVSRTAQPPLADLERTAMPMLDHIGREDVAAYGAKTANLGAIAGAQMSTLVIGSAVGPFFFAWVQAVAGSYQRALLISIIGPIASLVLAGTGIRTGGREPEARSDVDTDRPAPSSGDTTDRPAPLDARRR